MTEIAIDLATVLDFVERYNKKDEEAEVAQAAANIEKWIELHNPNK